MSVSFPVVVTSAGPQPTPPATILAQLIALVAATNPDYTANLPGSLIEDISSTSVGGIILSDQARVETINSLTPYGADAFTLSQLGQVYGVPLQVATNTSVSVVFSGPPGYVVQIGFTVSDGTYQYVVQDGGAIGSGGSSLPLYCLATVTGSWTVAPDTVDQLVTSIPSSLSPTLTCINPLPGTPSVAAQTEEAYRAQVLQAGLAASQGMARYLKTFLQNVTGVQARLVSVLQQPGGWEVICGGGDPYEVAYAIWQALFDVSTLVGSTLLVSGITKANPGVVTTINDHNYSTGQTPLPVITGIVGMTALNGVPLTITVLSPTTFSVGINTTGYGTYVSGGTITPVLRNVTAALYDYPDTYSIPFVNPPLQTLGILATYNTSAPNFVSQTAVQQAAVPALVAYGNSIYVGQPFNLNQAAQVFTAAVAGILSPEQITVLTFVIEINGIVTAPSAGTVTVYGDQESYFFATSASVSVVQA